MTDRVCPGCNGTAYGVHGATCGTCRGRGFVPTPEVYAQSPVRVIEVQEVPVEYTVHVGMFDLFLMSDGTVRWK